MKDTKAAEVGTSVKVLKSSEDAETVWQCVAEWASNTNCNGWGSVERSHHWARKMIWLILSLTGVVLTIYQLESVFSEYLQYPVSISVNVSDSASVEFPAVTICNENMVRKSQLGLVEGDFDDLLLISYGISNDTEFLSTSADRAELRKAFNPRWALQSEEMKTILGHQLEDMLIDCSFNGIECYIENFTHTLNPYFGNCYSFNSGWDHNSIRVSHKAGPLFGLSLEMFIEQDEYVAELTESAGLRVAIHHHEQMPFPEDDGLAVSPAGMTLMGLQMVEIIRQPYPYSSDCWDLNWEESTEYDVYSDIYDILYSRNGCLKTCFQAHMAAECGCYISTIPFAGQAVLQFTNKTIDSYLPCGEDDEYCSAPLTEQYIDGDLTCTCNLNCESTTYAIKISETHWPNNAFQAIYFTELAKKSEALSLLVTNQIEPGLQLVKLQIFYEDINYAKISETPAYTASTLLSNLGGCLGLFVGVSVVAFFEVFELVFDIFRIGCMKAVRRNRVNKIYYVH